jgi:uncharacterized protein
MRLLLSLHNVAPANVQQLDAAERVFEQVGIETVTYLLVPRFHRSAPCHLDDAWLRWIRRPRPWAIEWVLHGYDHLEAPSRRWRATGARARLANQHLRPILAGHGVRFPEDHRHIFDLAAGTSVCSPVITWSSRTAIRRQASRAVTRLQRRGWRETPVLRIAVHPSDLDHAAIVREIVATVTEARRRRLVNSYADLLDVRTRQAFRRNPPGDGGV